MFYRTSSPSGLLPCFLSLKFTIMQSRAKGIADHILHLGDWMRPERAELRLERADLRPERADLRPERADLRSERVDWRPERADLRPERADLRLRNVD